MSPGMPVRKPYAGVDFIPQSEIYEFGFWSNPYAHMVGYPMMSIADQRSILMSQKPVEVPI